jgi:phage major head subunit gpT-like protein
VDEKGHLDEVGRVWYYAFRAQDFIDYMRRHKALIVQEHQVHTILHRVLDNDDTGDCMRDRFRVGERTLRNVWCVPEQIVSSESVPEKKFSAEF